MNYSINLIISTLDTLCILGGDKQPILEKLKEAKEILESALQDMDGLTVAGRGVVDALLGCMMATEAIIGEGGDDEQ